MASRRSSLIPMATLRRWASTTAKKPAQPSFSDFFDKTQASLKAASLQSNQLPAVPTPQPLPVHRHFRIGEAFRPVDYKRENLFPARKPRRVVRLPPSSADTWLLDPFKRFSLDPLREPHNVHLLTPYLDELGRIRGRAMTGLSIKSQARVTKAIKRARAMGLLPVFGRDDSGAASASAGRRAGTVNRIDWMRRRP